MDQNRRIVAGVDGSPGGRLALTWALAEASRRGGTVHAVIAWQWDGPAVTPAVEVHPDATKDRAIQTLSRELDAACADFTPAPTIISDVVHGAPAAVLARAASGADLLVLGSHGHGRLRHAVVGSVSEECIRHAPCPVVVVPAPAPVAATAERVAVG